MSSGYSFKLLLGAIIGALALSGCANLRDSEKPDEGSQSATNTGNDNPARFRARTHTELGATYLQRGQFSVALEELNQAVKVDPQYGLAHSLLGVVHGTLGENVKAEAAFQRAVQVAPSEGDIRNSYGAFLCSQNRAKDGLEQFEAALRLPLYQTPFIALENAGSCALNARMIKPAETYYGRLVQIQPLSSRGYQGLAAIAFMTSRMDEVKRQVELGMRANPLTPELLFYGACAARKLSERGSEDSLTQVLKSRFPDSPFNDALRKGGCE
jgi:type IV pilus assembly protein PilF